MKLTFVSLALLAASIISVSVQQVFAKDKVIARFDLKHGAHPQVGLVADAQGNLFGVAPNGGAFSCGAAFELSPASSGGWTKTLIYSFQGGTGDGCMPNTQMVFDAQGNLFGATSGNNSPCTVFELIPSGNLKWTEKTIYTFTGAYGQVPGAKMAIDSSGNLFGSLEYGGSANRGAVFALHQANGTWTETLIWQFSGSDGSLPLGGVVLDSRGDLFGTTSAGGASGADGTIFQLSPNGGGDYSHSILYNFPGAQGGGFPEAPLAIDSNGNLFGVTSNIYDGIYQPPAVVAFELSPVVNSWKESIIHTYSELSNKVYGTPSGFTLDANGNLYGVTEIGGTACNAPGCGVVYELSPPSNGKQWSLKVLHQFQGADDGTYPVGNVLLLGNQIYGTTEYGGGMFGYGTVFNVAY